MIAAAPWRERNLSLGDCLAIGQAFGSVCPLGWIVGPSGHVLVATQPLVLFVVQVTCADGRAVHFSLSSLAQGCGGDGGTQFNSIHN